MATGPVVLKVAPVVLLLLLPAVMVTELACTLVNPGPATGTLLVGVSIVEM